MHAVEIGIAAGGEGAQQVQRRRRLPVGLELARGSGMRASGVKCDVVDDVAAVARQLDAADASRSATSAAWRTGRRCGRPSPPASRRQRSAPPPSAGTRGRSRGCCRRECSAKLSAQSPPWSRKASPAATSRQRLLQLARLAGKNQRRKAGELLLDRLQGCLIRIVRNLLDGLCPPAIGRPTLGHGSCSCFDNRAG